MSSLRLGMLAAAATRNRGNRKATTAAGASGCRGTEIKGNISRNSGERIYHVPGSSSYDETRIDEADGERWFCTEDDARRAGWRARR